MKADHGLRTFSPGVAVCASLLLLGACGSGDGTATPIRNGTGTGTSTGGETGTGTSTGGETGTGTSTGGETGTGTSTGGETGTGTSTGGETATISVSSPTQLGSLLMTRFLSEDDFEYWSCSSLSAEAEFPDVGYAFFSPNEGAYSNPDLDAEFTYEVISEDAVLLSYANGTQEDITSVTFFEPGNSWTGFSTTDANLDCQLFSNR